MTRFCLGFTTLIYLLQVIASQEFAPIITEHPSSAIVTRNKPHTLRCRAEANPSPTYRWYKDGRPLLPSSHYSVLSSGALFFLRVAQSRSQHDTGIYICEATNYLGTARSQNVTLDVAYMRDDFRKLSQDLVAVSGDALQLECAPPRSNPVAIVSWEKDGQEVVLEATESLQDGNLYFTRLRTRDEGVYVCIATNMADTKRSQPINLQVTDGPEFLVIPEDTVAIVGQTVRLECEADGQPMPVITWSRLEGSIPSDRMLNQEDNSLSIIDVALADSDTYICTAESTVATRTKQAILKIVTSIDFVTEPKDETVRENGVTSFQCVANGNPRPTVFWQKDGVQEPMFPGQNYDRYSVLEDGTLTIVRVQASDEGRYTCSAVDLATVTTTSAYLTVTAVVDGYPPIINLGVINQTLVAADNAMLPCQVLSEEQVSILWLMNGSPIARDDRITQLSSGTLQISGLQTSDSALYTCVASQNGAHTNWNATLLVIGSDEIGQISIRKMPPENTLPSSPQQLVVSNITSNSALLSWQLPEKNGGYPVTDYRLEYYIQGRSQGWMVLMNHLTQPQVEVNNLEDVTTYRFLIRAANARGLGYPSEISPPITTLGFELTPVPPVSTQQRLSSAEVTIVEVQVLSSTAVKLIWQVSQHWEYIEGFYVLYRKVSGFEQPVVEAVRDVSMLLITQLNAATFYSFSIQPFYQQYVGLETTPFTISTLNHGDELPVVIGGDDVLQDKLNQCDLRLRSVDVVGPRSIKVMWRLQNDVCKEYVDGYHVKYYKGTVDGQYYTKTVKKSRMVTLDELAANSVYFISVVPFNGQQQGKGSEVRKIQLNQIDTSSVSQDGLPLDVKVQVRSSNMIAVEWKPPVETRHTIVDYLVMCLGNSSRYHRNITTLNNSTFSVLFSDLEPGMAYTILVAARIQDSGVGSFSRLRIGPPSTVSVQLYPDTVLINTENNDSIVTSPMFIGTVGAAITILVIIILTILFVRQKRRKKKKQGVDTKVVFSACGGGDMDCSVYKPPVGQLTSIGHDSEWNSNTWQTTRTKNHEYTVNTYGFHSNGDQHDQHECSKTNTWSSAARSTLDAFHCRINNTETPEYEVVQKSNSPSCSVHGIHVMLPSNSKQDPFNIEPYASTSLIQARYLHQQEHKCSENSLNRARAKAPWLHGEILNNGYSSSDGSVPPPLPHRCSNDGIQNLSADAYCKPVELSSPCHARSASPYNTCHPRSASPCNTYHPRSTSPCNNCQPRSSSPYNTCQTPTTPTVHITTNPLVSRNITFHGGIPHIPYQPAIMALPERPPTPPARQWATSPANSCSDNNPSPPCDQPKNIRMLQLSNSPEAARLNDLSSQQIEEIQHSLPLHKYYQQQNYQQRAGHECPDDVNFPQENVELDYISNGRDSLVTSCTSDSRSTSSSVRHSRTSMDDSDGSEFIDAPNINAIQTDEGVMFSKSSIT